MLFGVTHTDATTYRGRVRRHAPAGDRRAAAIPAGRAAAVWIRSPHSGRSSRAAAQRE